MNYKLNIIVIVTAGVDQSWPHRVSGGIVLPYGYLTYISN